MSLALPAHRLRFWLGCSALILIVAVLYVLPVMAWAMSLFSTTQKGGVLPLTGLLSALLPYTVQTSSLAAVLAVILGSAIALLHHFSPRLVQRVLQVVMTIPLIVGFLARNYSWIGLLSWSRDPSRFQKWIGLAESPLYSKQGVLLVLATVFIPFAYFIVLQGLSSLRFEQFEAGRTLGVPDGRLFLVIALPVALRSIMLALGLTFVLAVGYFVTPRMIGGGQHEFIGNGVVRMLSLGETETASMLAAYLFLTAALPMVAILIFTIRRRAQIMGR